jgi:hypothetical protein
MGDPVNACLILSLFTFCMFTLRGAVMEDRKARHKRALGRSAELEHELGLIPHVDPDIRKVCPHTRCGLPRVPTGPAPGAREKPNE